MKPHMSNAPTPHSKPATAAYHDAWDRIFGKSDISAPPKPEELTPIQKAVTKHFHDRYPMPPSRSNHA